MIVVRVFGREVLAVGREADLDEPDGGADLTGGSYEIGEQWTRDPDADVYLTSRRRRPPITRHRSGEVPFGFALGSQHG